MWMVYKVKKEKSPITIVAEMVDKNYAYVLNFINNHPEFGIVKDENNKYVMDESQQKSLCIAIQKHEIEREHKQVEREKKKIEQEKKRIEREKKREKNKAKKEKVRKMTEQENKEWDELYEYVRTMVMGYDGKQYLEPYIVLRLKGIVDGKIFANNNHKNKAHYSYTVVLNTFKYCMPDIQRAVNRITFKDTCGKFNYIMRIVENNINTVYMRMKNAEKVKEETDRISASRTVHKRVEYKPKKTVKQSDMFADLW